MFEPLNAERFLKSNFVLIRSQQTWLISYASAEQFVSHMIMIVAI